MYKSSYVTRSEQEYSSFLIFRTRPTIPPEAWNIKLWQPVVSLSPTGTWLSAELTLSLLVVAFSHCWHASGLQTKGQIGFNFKSNLYRDGGSPPESLASISDCPCTTLLSKCPEKKHKEPHMKTSGCTKGRRSWAIISRALHFPILIRSIN